MPTTINGTTGVSQVQDGIVTPVKTQVGALPSMVRLNTANGYGSTNTKIRRFTNQVTNQGTDITYADSATLGASFTINTAGVYSVSFSDCLNGVSTIGLSLNTVNPTTNIYACPVAEQLAAQTQAAANFIVNCSWTGYLPAGSVIRPHTEGGGLGTQGNSVQFTIQRVA